MAYSSASIANYFLRIAWDRGVVVTPMMLQKLVYFAHGWCLGLTDKPLINEYVEAWTYGPVIPSLYHEFKEFGGRPITRLATQGYSDSGCFREADPPQDHFTIALLDKIWAVYGHLTAIQLSNLTHLPDTPWTTAKISQSALMGKDMDNGLIQKYYQQQGQGHHGR